MARVVAVLASALLCATVMTSCGGGDSAQPLSSDEIAALTQSLTGSLNLVGATSTTRPVGSPSGSPKTPVSDSVACPASGHIRSSGNIMASCPNPFTPGSCTLAGVVNMRFGDPVSNTDDCTYASGFVVDGSVTVMMSGTDLALKVTLTGMLDIARKGPSGGLIPLDLCFINLVALAPALTLTGSVCGQAINQSF